MNMRIAMLTNNYKPFVGGVPISVERLAQGLRRLGHEVYVFAPSYEGQEDEPYVIRCKSRKKKLGKNIVIPDMLDRTVEDTFAAIRFDVIHVHHPVLMGYTAHYLRKKYGIPVVFTYHTRYEQYIHYVRPYNIFHKHRQDYLPYKLLYSGSEKIVQLHNRIFTNRCDMVFAPTHSIKQYLEENGVITDIEVVPTGINEEDFSCDTGMVNAIRNQYLEGRKFLLCTVSRLGKEKNLNFLLSGLARFKERKGDCFRLLLIGDGDEKDALQSEAERLGLADNIIFTGCIDHSLIRNYCCASDLFVFTSRSETQGIVLLEAMAAGLPVVAVKATGVNDVVIDGWNGYLSEPDRDEWEENLEIILENTVQRAWMRQNAVTEAEQYLACTIARRVEKLYQNLTLYQITEQAYEKTIV